jgi:hypothetical protein
MPMRTLVMGCLLVAGLMLGAPCRAQTWTSPTMISTHDYATSFDGCSLPSETLYIESGLYSFYAPVAVYRIYTPPFGRPPIIRSWSLILQPQGWDASIWVCRTRQGNMLNSCEDGSDNWGLNAFESVTVPAAWGTHYIVVTGNIENSAPMCGQFVLTAHRN